MIFLTVGTQFGFDRLVQAVDEAVEQGLIDTEVVAQIGAGTYRPRHLDAMESLPKDAFDRLLTSADALISHAGIGSIAMAIQTGKPLLVMPRLKKYREHVNDHQLHTARKFDRLGTVLVAYDTAELAGQIQRLAAFVPTVRRPNRQGLTDRIETFLRGLT